MKSSRQGVYIEGKYELNSTDEPCSGIAQAFGELCDTTDQLPSETIVEISNSIIDNMWEEAEMLMGLIPELDMFFCDSDKDVSNVGSDPGREHERWKYAFRMLTRILGTYMSPIVIILDDLQWADISSLDTMYGLISDFQNPNGLMIIGCYRSNEVDENSICTTASKD